MLPLSQEIWVYNKSLIQALNSSEFFESLNILLSECSPHTHIYQIL